MKRHNLHDKDGDTNRYFMRFTNKVIPSRLGNVGIIQLNNPASLHSLDIDMVRFLHDWLSTVVMTSPTATSTSSSSAANPTALPLKSNTLHSSITNSGGTPNRSQEDGHKVFEDDAFHPQSCSSPIKAMIFTSSSSNSNSSLNMNRTRRSFCAGGDMKRLYLAGMGLKDDSASSGDDVKAFENGQHGYGKMGLETADFFREEYQLNYKLSQTSIKEDGSGILPQVSIWDGIVMGGGVGLSIHGTYRVATERTVFAMPETNIGFFPDVGSTYVLPRLKGGIGNYIALTGARLHAHDLIYTGLATHYIPSKDLDCVMDAIVANSMRDPDGSISHDCVASALEKYHEDLDENESYLSRHQEQIDEAFQDKTCLEDIIDTLKRNPTEFTMSTLERMGTMSPTSLKVTLDSMNRGKELQSLGECLQMEYRMSQVAMRRKSDFYEGIRALLVDKDKKPKWNPDNLSSVTDDIVASYFENLGENELVLRS